MSDARGARGPPKGAVLPSLNEELWFGLAHGAHGMSVESPFTSSSSTAFTSARLLLATIFLIAGIPKIVAGKDLSNTVRALGVERRGGVVALRIGVPIAETALGVWLLMGPYPAAAAFSAATMLTLFTYALIQLRKNEAGACACFFWDNGSVSVGHVIRNLVLLAVAISIGIATLFSWYTWEPVWDLPARSALTACASVLFVLLLYALIVATLHLARYVITES